ncbi:MAG: uracil-xanthine permease, partial [Clostridiales bacterium]|nr:uracil-xanthine permease [Clostridiales bacterium]
SPLLSLFFAEHLADHKNISSIIGTDLTREPGLHRTLLGDGVGSMVGAFFGGCPNTTYGESVGCVAISGNASVVTIITAAIICIVSAFFAPFMTLLATIPSCVMGGVCMTLYGFIAVSGLKMIQKVDLSKNHNLFTVSVILIAGVGGMVLNIGKITITSIACALILGILTNLLTSKAAKKEQEEVVSEQEEKVA